MALQQADREKRQQMNLVKLIEQFGSDERCRSYLEHLRWPDGVRCINCGLDSISRITTRRQLDCNNCRTRFSVTSGTVFHDSHLPLWKWFLAIYMMGEARKGVSANQLKRTLAVSYKTAWYLCHRIRWAMGLGDEPQIGFGGTVEADETYIGGKLRTGTKRANMLRNKTMVIGAIERGQIDPEAGFAVITSRCSFEMVQKAATIRIPILVAISAPTTMALRIAEQTGITLVALARSDSITVYASPGRIRGLAERVR